jgi:hypothetical protein
MGHLLSSSIGETYRRHITQVGIHRNCEMCNTIEEIATSRFFTWKTNENFEIEQMRGAPHCDPYEAFKACKFLGVGINYLNDNLHIFLNQEYLKPDESLTPIFTDKQNSIKDVSKKLTELRRRFYALKRDENKYRGVVLKTLVNQPISNFMYANCKTPFTNSLFRFTVKARSQYLVTPFMRHLIFRKGNGICNLCNRDRMDTLYHILNGCPKLTAHYTNRHNKIVQVVVEAISTNCNLYTETIHENKCVVIDEKLSKNGKFKTKIRPDIWYWAVSNKGKIAPTTFLTLHMVEIKACWAQNMKKHTIEKKQIQ